MIQRQAFSWKLHRGHVQDYIDIHAQIPSELVALYRDAGIREIVCYLNGDDLLMTLVYDNEIYTDDAKIRVNQSEISRQWLASLQHTADANHKRVEFRPVFVMEDHHGEGS